MANSNIERLNIMGTPLTLFESYQQAVSRIIDCVRDRQHVSCFAINPLKVTQARGDQELQQLAQTADFCICDGVGVAAAARILLGRKIPRITGIRLFFELAAQAETQGLRIFLLGGTPGSNEGAFKKLKHMHPQLKIVGSQHGYFSDDNAVIAQINKSCADMLFVAMGSPRQEKWIAKYRKQLEVPYCMGVGGSLDVLSGRAHWAPKLFRKTGTEWLYRLIRQPSRIQRQRMLPVFALSVMWQYFRIKMTALNQDKEALILPEHSVNPPENVNSNPNTLPAKELSASRHSSVA